MKMIFPNKLKSGDLVGLAAPCSHQTTEALSLVSSAIEFLESWGLKVQLQKGHDHQHFYLAGSDQHRAEQFQALYTNPEIKAVFFTRGGYGASRLYQHLDDQHIRQHHKIVVGLSDVTSLLLYLQKVCGMVVYHGPNLAASQFLESDQRKKTQASLHDALFLDEYFPSFSVSTIQPGQGKGLLTGGCLSLVVTTLGTPYEIETEGKILFLEDVQEQPFRIDRMLTHLRNTGKLDRIQGIVFAEMVECEGEQKELWNILADFFKDDPFPVVYGLPSGHGIYSLTVPLGVEAELDSEKGTLQLVP